MRCRTFFTRVRERLQLTRRHQFRKPLSQLGIYLTRRKPYYEKATVLIRIYCGGICSRQLGRGKCRSGAAQLSPARCVPVRSRVSQPACQRLQPITATFKFLRFEQPTTSLTPSINKFNWWGFRPRSQTIRVKVAGARSDSARELMVLLFVLDGRTCVSLSLVRLMNGPNLLSYLMATSPRVPLSPAPPHRVSPAACIVYAVNIGCWPRIRRR